MWPEQIELDILLEPKVVALIDALATGSLPYGDAREILIFTGGGRDYPYYGVPSNIMIDALSGHGIVDVLYEDAEKKKPEHRTRVSDVDNTVVIDVGALFARYVIAVLKKPKKEANRVRGITVTIGVDVATTKARRGSRSGRGCREARKEKSNEPKGCQAQFQS